MKMDNSLILFVIFPQSLIPKPKPEKFAFHVSYMQIQLF